jgi:type VI secretion system protein VasD
LIIRRSFLLLPAALAACAAPPPPPATLNLTLQGGPDQNPDPSGKPATVAVRLFQLAAVGKFERADAFALIEREAGTLGADDLGSEEFVIGPGEKRLITRELKKGVQVIGIGVWFRDIDNAKWRTSAAAPATGTLNLTLKTAGTISTLAPG